MSIQQNDREKAADEEIDDNSDLDVMDEILGKTSFLIFSFSF